MRTTRPENLKETMRTLNTCDLKDADLLWAVAQANFQRMEASGERIKPWALDQHKAGYVNLTLTWVNLGEIVDTEHISVTADEFCARWSASAPCQDSYCGSSALEALARAYVGLVIGETVNLPDRVTDDLEEFVERRNGKNQY